MHKIIHPAMRIYRHPGLASQFTNPCQTAVKMGTGFGMTGDPVCPRSGIAEEGEVDLPGTGDQRTAVDTIPAG